MEPNSYPFTIEIVTDPEDLARSRRRYEQFEKNRAWLETHAAEVFRHRGKYFCVAGQELFVADTFNEAWDLGKAAHPEDEGLYLQYIPVERVPRIYAN